MYFLPEPVGLSFTAATMSVALDEGRTITVPLAWNPHLLCASQKQFAAFEPGPPGTHWDEVDENISVEGMLASRGDMTRSPLRAA